MRLSDGLTTVSLDSLLDHFSGRNCYFAPTRFEKHSSSQLDRPFGSRVLVGQNACSEPPPESLKSKGGASTSVMTAATASGQSAFWGSGQLGENVHFYAYAK